MKKVTVIFLSVILVLLVLMQPISVKAGSLSSYEDYELGDYTLQVDSGWKVETSEITDNISRTVFSDEKTFSVSAAALSQETLPEGEELFLSEDPGEYQGAEYFIRLICFGLDLDYPESEEIETDFLEFNTNADEMSRVYYFAADDSHDIRICVLYDDLSILAMAADVVDFGPAEEAELFRFFVTAEASGDFLEEESDLLEKEEEEIEENTGKENVKGDFKSFFWGDSKEDVISVEGEPDYDGGNALAYADRTIKNLDANLFYYFCDQGLYQVFYVLQESHTSEEIYLSDYSIVVDALTKKYGKPSEQDEIWYKPEMKDYATEAEAIQLGYMFEYTRWYTDTTEIFISISADNYEFNTMLVYSSLEIEPEEDESYLDDL